MLVDATRPILVPPTSNAARLHPQTGGEIMRLGGDTMGTSWSVAIVAGPGLAAANLADVIELRLGDIVAQMSQWEPQSELSRFNRAAPESWHIISPQFGVVVQNALEIARASDGAFDPAIGPLSALWGFGAPEDMARAPTTQEIGNGRRYSWQDIEYMPETHCLYQPGGLELDLSAIAKGFAVDYIIAVLEREGIRHALVEIGGELRAAGVKPDGQPWWVDLEAPPGQMCDPVLPVQPVRIALSGWAVATTGHHLRRRSAGGQSWSHSLSPDSGRPTEHGVDAVSVIHPQCMPADALATAIMVLGFEGGLAFANRHRLAVQMVAADRTAISDMWQQYCGADEPHLQETSL